MIHRPLTPARARRLLVAIVVLSLLPLLGCKVDPAPSLEIAGTSWRTFDSPLGFSIDYPDAYQVTDMGGGQPAFEYRGTIAARVVWVTEEEGLRRGLWFAAQPQKEMTMAGLRAQYYTYDHGDGPFFSTTHAVVIPHRGQFLGLELRTDGVDAVGQRMIDSVRVR